MVVCARVKYMYCMVMITCTIRFFYTYTMSSFTASRFNWSFIQNCRLFCSVIPKRLTFMYSFANRKICKRIVKSKLVFRFPSHNSWNTRVSSFLPLSFFPSFSRRALLVIHRKSENRIAFKLFVCGLPPAAHPSNCSSNFARQQLSSDF